MKLKHLILATSLFTASTTLADQGDFYLRLKLSHFYPQKIGELTSKPVLLPGIAIGYNISDDIRVDLGITHLSNIRHRGNVIESSPANNLLPPAYNICNCPPVYIHTVKPVLARAKLTTCKVNLFVDVYKIHDTSLYFGGGVGGTRIQRTMTIDNITERFKPYYTMSYDIHTGINRKIDKDTSVGIGYTFKNLTENTYNYKGHSIATSIKVDL